MKTLHLAPNSYFIENITYTCVEGLTQAFFFHKVGELTHDKQKTKYRFILKYLFHAIVIG